MVTAGLYGLLHPPTAPGPLRERFADLPNVTVVEADAKRVDLVELGRGRPLVLCGNIPYNPATDSWTLLSTEGQPSPTNPHSAARAAGDPETLDRANVASLETIPVLTWNALDAFGRRLFLAQVVTTEALFACVSD